MFILKNEIDSFETEVFSILKKPFLFFCKTNYLKSNNLQNFTFIIRYLVFLTILEDF